MFDLGALASDYVADPRSVVGNPARAAPVTALLEALSAQPTRVLDDEVWDGLLGALPPHANSEELAVLVDLVAQSLKSLANEASEAKANSDTGAFADILESLEKFAFALHVLLGELDKALVAAGQQQTAVAKRSTAVNIDGPGAMVSDLFSAIAAVLAIGLDALLPTTQARDTFASMYLRPAFRLLEQESVVKHNDLRRHIFRSISLAIKHQGQLASAHISATQLLTYYTHAAEPLAELMLVLHNEYDNTSLATLVIKDMGSREFTQQDTKGPKPVAAFLIHLTRLLPRFVHQQLAVLLPLLDSPSSSMRLAMIEVAGLVAVHLAKDEPSEDPETQARSLDDVVSLLIEHTNDTYSFCRSRATQTMLALCETPYVSQAYRKGFMTIASNKVQDKAVIVRHNAFKLLNHLITAHPFKLVEGSQLKIDEWQRRRDAVATELEAQIAQAEEMIRPSQLDSLTRDAGSSGAPQDVEMSEDAETEESNAPEDDPVVAAPNIEVVQKLQLMLKYHEDAIAFIGEIDKSLQTAEVLLRSKQKSDIVDSVEFFVLADAYGVQAAKSGIRKIVHLVWVKANNDEKDTVQKKAVNSYFDLFMNPPASMSPADGALYVAKSLISLTYNASTGELTSLAQLLGQAMNELMIMPAAVRVLWKIYSYDAKEISRSQRRGAAIILGILSKYDRNIALSGLDTLLRVGLGIHGTNDMELAKHTCVILQNFVSQDDWKKGEFPTRLPSDHVVFQKLRALLVRPAKSTEWFGMAQEALRAINDLSHDPNTVFSLLMQELHIKVFSSEDADKSIHYDEPTRQVLFAQLIFIAGEVAIRLLVHVERCEVAFKRARIAAEANAASAKDKDTSKADEMDLVASSATTEDDFMDAIREIREREILFSDRSLLAKYAPIVSQLCQDELEAPHEEKLAIAATSTLAKFMCVSSVYCEDNMSLLMDVMKNSRSPTIRSNLVVAMGDMAVCFNHIMDSHTDFLYGQLNDEFPVVQRTAVVTLTFLILGGQVKVKGQLGEMAKALESPDGRISSLAHMFFSELATKENAVYNSFLDILSGLSADLTLEEAALQRIIKFLVSFIDKERHVKQLTDKLAARLARCETKRQWQDTVFVLKCLPGDKPEPVAKLMEKEFTEFGVA